MENKKETNMFERIQTALNRKQIEEFSKDLFSKSSKKISTLFFTTMCTEKECTVFVFSGKETLIGEHDLIKEKLRIVVTKVLLRYTEKKIYCYIDYDIEIDSNVTGNLISVGNFVETTYSIYYKYDKFSFNDSCEIIDLAIRNIIEKLKLHEFSHRKHD
jgi:hypothetical protein